MLKSMMLIPLCLLLVSLMPPQLSAQDNLGLRWEETEKEWSGVWTRTGADVFGAVWTNPSGDTVTATLAISISGSSVFITRVQTGGMCAYVGTLFPSGTGASGTYGCDWARGPFPWNATIRKVKPNSQGNASFGVWAYRVNLNVDWDDPCNIAYVGDRIPNSQYENSPLYRLVRRVNYKADVDAILSFFRQYRQNQADGVVKMQPCHSVTHKIQ